MAYKYKSLISLVNSLTFEIKEKVSWPTALKKLENLSYAQVVQVEN
jgi:hypothetical protein